MTDRNDGWPVPPGSTRANSENSDRGDLRKDDPNSDFPFCEVYTDCAGQARHFVVSCHLVPLGFGVVAEEADKGGNGFFFREFDASSPYLALGRVRARIEQALATRHIWQPEPGNFQATHRTVRGRISSSDGEVAFVIDGQLLTLAQFGKLVETFEGFEFRLHIDG
jgi:hypothetical protein